jgi:hypothetical protein
VPSYWLVNASVAYDFGALGPAQNLTVALNLTNLTDKRYLSRSAPTAPTPPTDPQPGDHAGRRAAAGDGHRHRALLMRGPVDRNAVVACCMAWQGTGAAIALAAMPGLAGPRPRLGVIRSPLVSPPVIRIHRGPCCGRGWRRTRSTAAACRRGRCRCAGSWPKTPAHAPAGTTGRTAAAVPELAHSVHVEVNGLRPGRDYYYRFACDGDEESAVGHFRTASR